MRDRVSHRKMGKAIRKLGELVILIDESLGVLKETYILSFQMWKNQSYK